MCQQSQNRQGEHDGKKAFYKIAANKELQLQP